MGVIMNTAGTPHLPVYICLICSFICQSEIISRISTVKPQGLLTDHIKLGYIIVHIKNLQLHLLPFYLWSQDCTNQLSLSLLVEKCAHLEQYWYMICLCHIFLVRTVISIKFPIISHLTILLLFPVTLGQKCHKIWNLCKKNKKIKLNVMCFSSISFLQHTNNKSVVFLNMGAHVKLKCENVKQFQKQVSYV